ncbi:rhoptry-associated protein, putative [Babesia ovata]|uniref:Rhoptry-associated protein, putative n=1 Tax=Babesia ovata TaxID=189622 RepID=A0A2H6KBL6_9APIC|nr:rhoptry-associated protein, putative [Babesia ovata]GBE60388.1 rhoptry-associated protein, putative [Babesia ovata]
MSPSRFTMRSFVGVCFGALLLVARSGLAMRHYHRSAVMSPEVIGDVSKTLLEANEVVNADLEASRINKDMKDQLTNVKESIVDVVCRKDAGSTTCRKSVFDYVDRCDEGDCLTIDSVDYKPLSLPNQYQLDAAFMLFRECDSNPAKNEVKRFWMRSRSSHGDYHHFLISLAKKNIIRNPEIDDVENFASQYFYMTTLYYKTYLNVDLGKAKFFNKLAFTTQLFGFGIRKALKRLVRENLPVDLGIHPEARIRQISGGYSAYMLNQVPALPSFADRFSKMATETLLRTVSDYVHMPAYKKWYNKFKEFILGLFNQSSNAVVKHVAQPIRGVYRKVVPEAKGEAIRSAIGHGVKQVAKGINSLTAKIKEPSEQLLREKIPHYLSKAKGAVEHVVHKVKSKYAIKNGDESSDESGYETAEESSDESSDESGYESAEESLSESAEETRVPGDYVEQDWKEPNLHKQHNWVDGAGYEVTDGVKSDDSTDATEA